MRKSSSGHQQLVKHLLGADYRQQIICDNDINNKQGLNECVLRST